MFINNYCRDKGPKYEYWAVSHVRGHQVVRGQVIMTEVYKTMVCLVMRNWKCCPRRSTSSAKQSRGYKYQLLYSNKIKKEKKNHIILNFLMQCTITN